MKKEYRDKKTSKCDGDRLYGQMKDHEVLAMADRIMEFQKPYELTDDMIQKAALGYYAERNILRILLLYYWEMHKSVKVKDILEVLCSTLLEFWTSEENLIELILKEIEQERGEYENGYLTAERMFLHISFPSMEEYPTDMMLRDLLRALNEYMLSNKFIPFVSNYPDKVHFLYSNEDTEENGEDAEELEDSEQEEDTEAFEDSGQEENAEESEDSGQEEDAEEFEDYGQEEDAEESEDFGQEEDAEDFEDSDREDNETTENIEDIENTEKNSQKEKITVCMPIDHSFEVAQEEDKITFCARAGKGV